ncbi:MAG: sigma-70 family RNA polymerase sigma factor, partial [Anaerolineales bacterium]|nr:sigma-70 family RNA polymerase sigma factor [Anaerolineales bacterium]
MTAPTDRDLIVRARRGDGDAFSELVTRYQINVFNVCYRILHERGEAEDLAQETFMRAYHRLDQFDLEREFGPWVRRVAANLCINHLESQKVNAPLYE